jgi:hypothetical protein
VSEVKINLGTGDDIASVRPERQDPGDLRRRTG